MQFEENKQRIDYTLWRRSLLVKIPALRDGKCVCGFFFLFNWGCKYILSLLVNTTLAFFYDFFECKFWVLFSGNIRGVPKVYPKWVLFYFFFLFLFSFFFCISLSFVSHWYLFIYKYLFRRNFLNTVFNQLIRIKINKPS